MGLAEKWDESCDEGKEDVGMGTVRKSGFVSRERNTHGCYSSALSTGSLLDDKVHLGPSFLV